MRLTHKILKEVAALSKFNDWKTTEINIVQWNNNIPKVDICCWANNNGNSTDKVPLKGMTISYDVIPELIKALSQIRPEDMQY